MRSLMLITLLAICNTNSIAQHKQTREEISSWLKENLTVGRAASGQATAHHNATRLCVLREARSTEIADKEFSRKIESYISWKQNELYVQNDISENSKLQERYTYQIPLTAIVGAQLSNCRKNKYGIVDAYQDRPLFLAVRKNTTHISHIRFDKNGSIKTEHHSMNNTDADWDSTIPLVIDLDHENNLKNEVVNAFSRLVELNGGNYAVK
jgi:hypothetical protein